jgi:hypothetical protein
MGGETVFDLEGRIETWRSQLASTGTCRNEDIDELENHLREEVKHLLKKGLTEDESFLLALHQTGNTDAISCEFAKVNAGHLWKKRILWMLGGYFFFNILLSLLKTAQAAYFLTVKWGYIKTPLLGPQFPFPVIPLLFALVLAGCFYHRMTRTNVRSEILPDRLLHRNRWVLILLAIGMLAAFPGSIVRWAFTTKIADSQAVGRMAAADNMFEWLWNFFLAGSVMVVAFRLRRNYSRRSETLID